MKGTAAGHKQQKGHERRRRLDEEDKVEEQMNTKKASAGFKVRV